MEHTLYLSLDDLYFKQHSLIEVAERFHQQGGKHLFLDEVHKYVDWQREVKNLYDFNPRLQLVISGSSILALQRSDVDLSRRMLRYHLPELSFREFIALKEGVMLPIYTLEDVLECHAKLVDEVRINRLINLIIDYDLPEARPIESGTLVKLKTLLYIISTAVPFTPNIAQLAEKLGTSRNRLLEMLDSLEKAQLIFNLRKATSGISLMNKPNKEYGTARKIPLWLFGFLY